MSNFFSSLQAHLQSLFYLQPVGVWTYQWWYFGFIVLSLIVAIAPLFFKKFIHETLRNRLINWGWTQVLIGLVLGFARYYFIPYLGMDALRTLQELSAYAWMIFILRYTFTKLPTQLVKEKAEVRRNKYLPKN